MKYWYGFWIRLAFALRLRGLAITLQARLKGEHRAIRTPLPIFQTPEELVEYARGRFVWRKDETRLGGLLVPLDWISRAEVFHTRLLSKEQLDGDCDDYHFFIYTGIKGMPGVDRRYLLSVAYEGGAHTVCVYRKNSQWYLVNYDIHHLLNPNDAVLRIARWGTGNPAIVDFKYYCWETFDEQKGWRLVATCPSDLVSF